MVVLVTGGMGYIGSHTCVELLKENHRLIIIDNLSNSSQYIKDKIEKISKKSSVTFYKINLIDKAALKEIFRKENIEVVIHFAGLKAVGESVENPIKYYYNNVASSITLFDIMNKYNVKNLIFSSSATVYGVPKELPIKEDANLNAVNPYGNSKLMIENILKDISLSDENWNIVILRYFNPVGAHESGLIGENSVGIPNNLMPYICQVAKGIFPKLYVFGDNYNTPDGTGVRDYIHVVDLVKGHIKSINRLLEKKRLSIYNLGTGIGYSVLDIIKTFKEETGIKINYEITERRPGDISSCYADPSKARFELDWKAEKNLKDMCKDSWNFYKNSK